MLEHDPNLVLAPFNEADFVPRVVAFADEFETGGRGLAAMHGDAIAESFFFLGCEDALDFYQVGFGDVTGGRGEVIGEVAVVGKHQQAFAGVVETTDRIDALAHPFEKFHDGFAAFGIENGGHDVLRLIKRIVDEMFRRAEQLAVYFDLVRGKVGFGAQFGNGCAVHRDAARDDQFFGFAAAGDTGMRKNFLEAFFRHLRADFLARLGSHV